MARERAGHTLQTTALIDEVYLRLVTFKEVSWNDRAHFFAISAQLIRRILTDWARLRRFLKHGRDAHHSSLNEALGVSRHRGSDLIARGDALRDLAAVDPRESQVVELRSNRGLSVEETVVVLKVSSETVMRDWKMAELWIVREMSGGKDLEA